LAHLKTKRDKLTGFCRSGNPLHMKPVSIQCLWDCLVGWWCTWSRTPLPTHTDCSQSNREVPQTPDHRQDSYDFSYGSMHTSVCCGSLCIQSMYWKKDNMLIFIRADTHTHTHTHTHF